MQILNHSHYSYQHANQTLRQLHQAVSETHRQQISYHIKCFDDTLHSQQPDTFVKEFNDDDVAQIFMDTLEKNIKDIYKKFKFPKDVIMTSHDELVYDSSLIVTSVTKTSVKIECAIIVICLVSLEVLLMKSAT